MDYKIKYYKWKKRYLELKGGNIYKYGKDLPKFIIESKFPLIKNVDRDNTKSFDNEIRLMAGNDGIKVISDAIEDREGSNVIITNITPNIGSDLLNMIFRFQKMIAIDNYNDHNNTTNISKILKHNIDLYDVNLRINILQGSILNNLKKTEQEVVYIDGFFLDNKVINSRKRIYIENIEISDLVDLYKEKARLFVYRIPNDYDLNYMINKIDGRYYEILRYNKDKEDFLVMLVSTNQLKTT